MEHHYYFFVHYIFKCSFSTVMLVFRGVPEMLNNPHPKTGRVQPIYCAGPFIAPVPFLDGSRATFESNLDIWNSFHIQQRLHLWIHLRWLESGYLFMWHVPESHILLDEMLPEKWMGIDILNKDINKQALYFDMHSTKWQMKSSLISHIPKKHLSFFLLYHHTPWNYPVPWK